MPLLNPLQCNHFLMQTPSSLCVIGSTKSSILWVDEMVSDTSTAMVETGAL